MSNTTVIEKLKKSLPEAMAFRKKGQKRFHKVFNTVFLIGERKPCIETATQLRIFYAEEIDNVEQNSWYLTEKLDNQYSDVERVIMAHFINKYPFDTLINTLKSMGKFYFYLYQFLHPAYLDFPHIPHWYKPNIKSKWLRAWLFYCIRNPKDTWNYLSPKMRTCNLKSAEFEGFDNSTERQELEGIGGQNIGETFWYTKDYAYFNYTNVKGDTWFQIGYANIPRLYTARGSLGLMMRKIGK